MPHWGNASGVFSILTVSAGRLIDWSEGSGRPVSGAVGNVGAVVVVVLVVVVVDVGDPLKCTTAKMAAAMTMIRTVA